MSENTHIRKYPRTPHLPESPGATSDDKWASKETLAYLSSGIDLVVTEKMDGGNLSMYQDYFHARSLDSQTHPWDSAARALWANVRWDIPAGWRVSGESMYAQRSVAYDNLPGVFMVFGIWDENSVLLSWEETEDWAGLLGLPVVPVLYRGTDFQVARSIWAETMDTDSSEGFVVRNAGRVEYDDFAGNFAKWVRADHVQTDADWRHRDDFALNGFQ